MKVVREHYLRDDVWCGARHCMNCGQMEQENLLDSSPLSHSKLCSFPHYLLLDTNVVLHQVSKRTRHSLSQHAAELFAISIPRCSYPTSRVASIFPR